MDRYYGQVSYRALEPRVVMFDLAKLHPGIHAQHQKLRTMGIVLLSLMLLSLGDLIAVISSDSVLVGEWRAAAEPALITVLVIGAFLIYAQVWKKLAALKRASDVVHSQISRPMVLRTWKKDRDGARVLYWFELAPLEPVGCVTSSFAVVAAENPETALSQYCEQSWKDKREVREVVKAFVDDVTGLPVALQTIDALNWVGIEIHPIKADDKERMLQSKDSDYQLSGDAK